jgi:hypothetical protein
MGKQGVAVEKMAKVSVQGLDHIRHSNICIKRLIPRAIYPLNQKMVCLRTIQIQDDLVVGPLIGLGKPPPIFS